MINDAFRKKYFEAWQGCTNKGVMLSRLKTLKKTRLTEQSDTDLIRNELVNALSSDTKRIRDIQKHFDII